MVLRIIANGASGTVSLPVKIVFTRSRDGRLALSRTLLAFACQALDEQAWRSFESPAFTLSIYAH